ncbi:MAG: imidazolonepropionase [Microbacterium sp. SCN 70-200]|uniref:imidazolonepropionase n=1 Tax=unclassified Microbacterium TaxID=2609290 RepID=UPI00086E965A|nr:MULTISPECIES: imidazolonepropionase [unclassified Microbacterium]MBN9213467.1 imidazolonepropionase [Microbacterium sp.]ODT41709.1 MAG: imidazolonepropionase [Microbacterium sp. SCN 70-200]OJV85099.1 MAG: imidazolonepropionase [Microbacterium sp. 70-16]
MTRLLITGIGELTTNVASAGDPCGTITDAAILIEDGRIAWVGGADPAPEAETDVLDAAGRAVIPGFVDSHTHLVFGGDRADEFAARMAGQAYAAGGIRRTVAATRAATDDELRARLKALVAELHAQGTTTFEVKTGYDLTVAGEQRLARLAAEVTDEVTFLGAHVVAPEYADDRAAYVDLVCGVMLAAVRPYARWIDVFCETGAFTPAETKRILRAGIAAGLRPRVHGNQLGPGDGARLAVALGAASVDHCTYLSDDDVAALAASTTVATLLPGVEFSTRHPYPDARRLIDAGVTVALASDCNPGTSFTTSMPLMIALAVREMGMTVAEAVWAATAGGARALERDDVGHLGVGARADLVILDAPTSTHLAYRPGVPLVHTVVKDGVPLR